MNDTSRDQATSLPLRIGLALSGGGFRASIFHLGVIRRLERTGMRWRLEGAQAILGLRATYLNEDWDGFWEHYTAAEKERLYGELNLDNSHAYRATG